MEVDPNVRTEHYIHHARYLELLKPIEEHTVEHEQRALANRLLAVIGEIIKAYPPSNSTATYAVYCTIFREFFRVSLLCVFSIASFSSVLFL
jgi:hypothetical protein